MATQSGNPTQRPPIWRNIGFALVVILLWCATRFMFIRLHWTNEYWQFRKYDLLFILLPASGAFFLNWYWLRDQRTDVMTKYAMFWALLDVAVFIVVAIFAQPLHVYLSSLSTT